MKRNLHPRRILPLVVSLGLIAWVFWRISPQALIQAVHEVNWTLLLPATAAMVLSLYFWDAVCLGVVYRIDQRPWSYGRALHLRGLSYLGAAVHYELGQVMLAWAAAKFQKTGVVRMLSRSVVLAYHDVLVLLGLGLVGSLLTDDARIQQVQPFLVAGLVGVLLVAFLVWAAPARMVRHWKTAETLLTDWSIRRSLVLIPLRCVYFSILLLYAVTALEIVRIPVDLRLVFGTVPLVLLADGLPNIAGLGTRDAALQLLLHPPRREVLLALSLVWTTGLVVGRAAIGLVHLALDPRISGSATELIPSDRELPAD
jgi:Lysylphosphatidylglycerol synthase TM region